MLHNDQSHSVFEYLYRDAANYKAWGSLLLSGVPSQENIAALRACMESGEYFVAEQVGIRPLYEELWALSDGPTEDDHALHEFVELRSAKQKDMDSLPVFGELTKLLKVFQAISRWDYSLSPNCGMGHY
jgi:hypothetical protein